ncbi:shikimate kinase [Brevibacillus fluminis]|uniref:Shikimate kinase n=1 Tax=Brevibacillus fluminis TaxID=511487 RepID=A0A3M8CV09_9BACL|nr:shikimate kinase [Brevibacillus fluminis]RNB79221.1 shikimate kinase [Brevibacillus fluminis]
MQTIILIGFMGTGKTTVGRALAEKLGLTQVDMDASIEQREGCTIADLFRDKGEAYFRDVESEVLSELLQQDKLVITTGGGAVVRPANRELMAQNGLVIALDATEEEIVKRVKNDPDRPLLAGDPAERVRTLKKERAGLYQFAPIQIDTTGKSVETILAEISDQMVTNRLSWGD